LNKHVGGEDKQRCIEAGMNAVLSKPLIIETAGDILDAFIPQRANQKLHLLLLQQPQALKITLIY
jgi:two-component system, OmpR family, aerobic respiration control sensor histidine kinase ArcB